MGSYKHIERCIGDYIARHYTAAVEVGIGRNTTAAEIVHRSGALLRCTDVRELKGGHALPFCTDDIFSADLRLYEGADVIYSIRPAIEMCPPLIAVARAAGCDLLIYHLGFEIFADGGERIDCGVVLHRYHVSSEPVKQG